MKREIYGVNLFELDWKKEIFENIEDYDDLYDCVCDQMYDLALNWTFDTQLCVIKDDFDNLYLGITPKYSWFQTEENTFKTQAEACQSIYECLKSYIGMTKEDLISYIDYLED